MNKAMKDLQFKEEGNMKEKYQEHICSGKIPHHYNRGIGRRFRKQQVVMGMMKGQRENDRCADY